MNVKVQYLLLFILFFILFGCNEETGKETEQTRKQPFNVLFIAVDDLNDWVGFLDGHPQAKTPNLDRLAAQSMVFERAYCAAPACNPSRTAIMTGYRPSTTGVYGNSDFMRDSEILREARTIPQYFAQFGYRTMSRGKIFHHANGPWSDSLSWEQMDYAGGDWMRNHPGKTSTTLNNGMSYQTMYERLLDWGALSDVPMDQTMDIQTAMWASDLLAKQHQQPFFLACGLFRPHLPWYVPQKYFDQFPLEKIQLPPIREKDLEDIPSIGKELSGGLDPNKDYQRLKRNNLLKQAVQAYLACISYADHCVGKVLDALENGPNKDNTIVVLWGDHGWNLGEKLHYRKFVLWEESCRVPLIIKSPGLTKAGSRCQRTVNLIDLYPTLTELCGLTPNTQNEGRSLVPLLANPSLEWNYPSLTTIGQNRHSVRDEQWRYIRYDDGSEELYDHNLDPQEWKNLANDPSYKDLKKELAEWFPKVNEAAISGNTDVRGTALDKQLEQ